MRHLTEDELVARAFDHDPSGSGAQVAGHLEHCAECRAALGCLARAVALLEAEPMEPAPLQAWQRLRSRLEAERVGNDWTEPRWLPLILAHAGGAALVLVAIVLAGAWLETTVLWHSIRLWPLARATGGWGVAGVLFFLAGTLATLAMAPVLWWESRQPHSAN